MTNALIPTNTVTYTVQPASLSGFSIDVTPCNLDPDLSIKDFVAVYQIRGSLPVVLNNDTLDKNSRTVLTYNGINLEAGVTIAVNRDTTALRVQETIRIGSVVSSSVVDAEVQNIYKLLAERINSATVQAPADYVAFRDLSDTIPLPLDGFTYLAVDTNGDLQKKRTDGTTELIPTITQTQADDSALDTSLRAYIDEQIALLALAPLAPLYPIGSLYFNATNPTNPTVLLGFGTWEAFGAGRVPVGHNSGDPDFATAGNTGGAKIHNHTLNGGFAKMASISNNIDVLRANVNPSYQTTHRQVVSASSANISVNHTKAVALGGTTDASGSLPPYVVVYIWRRTA